MAFQCFAKRQEPFISGVTWIPFICIPRSGLKLLLTVEAKSALHLPETQRGLLWDAVTLSGSYKRYT